MQGIRILDISRVLAGPWAVQHLADQGAHVIKVEPPGGDETRRFGPLVDGQSTYFLAANRNKLGIVLDLKTAGGAEVLARVETPKPILETLNGAVVKALKDPGIAAKLAELGAVPRPSTMEEFAAYMKDQEAGVSALVKSGLLKPS